MSKESWRSSDAHHHTVVLDPSELAWEFLRRNPDYCALFAAHSKTTDRKADNSAKGWGLRFLADPKKGAHETAVYWHPEELASLVILAPAPASVVSDPFVVDDWLMHHPLRHANDGTYILIKDGKARYQILLTTPPRHGAIRVALLPMDCTTPRREQATQGFWGYAARGHPRPRFTGASRLGRLNMALRALDLRQSGASYRTIAETLLGARPTDAAPWKTAAVRDTAIRLVRTGLSMMQGGYRRLLGPSPADPSTLFPSS